MDGLVTALFEHLLLPNLAAGFILGVVGLYLAIARGWVITKRQKDLSAEISSLHLEVLDLKKTVDEYRVESRKSHALLQAMINHVLQDDMHNKLPSS